jgi:hypothetical protein
MAIKITSGLIWRKAGGKKLVAHGSKLADREVSFISSFSDGVHSGHGLNLNAMPYAFWIKRHYVVLRDSSKAHESQDWQGFEPLNIEIQPSK